MRREAVSDRIILAMRDRWVRDGFVECVRLGSQIHVATKRHGPAHQRLRLRIRSGSGRPRAGEIGVVRALASYFGCSRDVIHRALAGAPRAGSRRSIAVVSSPQPVAPVVSPTRDLAAVGLRTVLPPLPAARDMNQELRSAVAETIHAALSAGALPNPTIAHAEALVQMLEPG